ncbi:hypothetical protein TELCIR_05874 [Teladorsagia circumcincta]|uniref:Uncharacterized protein n=1 Tax=Teladorsagia circumcincta TaxID=45464 RepID=A0A2G9UR84_TELCI|nr:hypothetical protein TELCIR_05874 [Teladorsagia circumcincta]
MVLIKVRSFCISHIAVQKLSTYRITFERQDTDILEQEARLPTVEAVAIHGAAALRVENFQRKSAPRGMLPSKQKSFRTDLSPDDVKLVNARQFSRGKMLQIFSR